MSKIIVFVGPSGSGKSTETQNILKRDNSYFRINRDDMRKQLVGKLDSSYYQREDFRVIEKKVSELLHEQTLYFLNNELNIIMDNTHLQKKYIDEIISNYNHLADIELRFIKIDYDEAVKRLINREGENYDIKYLKSQYKDYDSIYREYKNTRFFPKQDTRYYPHTNNLPKCIVCDLDGTLSLFDKKLKSPYNRDFENDEVNLPVLMLIQKSIIDGIKVFLFSGRTEDSREQTELFLNISCGLNSNDYTLVMRPSGIFISDTIIKKQMFEANLRDQYNVLFAIDDRLQVIEGVWNKLGIHVLNVNQGNKRF